MKRLLSLILVFTLLLGCFPISGFASDSEAESETLPANPSDETPPVSPFNLSPLNDGEPSNDEGESPNTELEQAIERIKNSNYTDDDVTLFLRTAADEAKYKEIVQKICNILANKITDAIPLENADIDFWLNAINTVSGLSDLAACLDFFKTAELSSPNEANAKIAVFQAKLKEYVTSLHSKLTQLTIPLYLSDANLYNSRSQYFNLLRGLAPNSDEAFFYLDEIDLSQHFFTFSGDNLRWAISGYRNGHTVSLIPGEIPFVQNAIETVELDMNWRMSLNGQYMTVSDSSFGQSSNPAEAALLWVFRQDENETLLNGFQPLTNPDEIVSGESYLIGFSTQPETNLGSVPFYLLDSNNTPLFVMEFPNIAKPSIPDPSIPGLGRELLLNWDATETITESNVLIVPQATDSTCTVSSNGICTWKTSDDTVKGDTVKAEFSVPMVGSAQSHKLLSACAYSFNGNTFSANSDSLFNNKQSIIVQRVGEMQYHLISDEQFLSYSDNRIAWSSSPTYFYLFRQEDSVYFPMDAASISDGRYVLACKTADGSWMVVDPVESTSHVSPFLLANDSGNGWLAKPALWPHTTSIRFTGLNLTEQTSMFPVKAEQAYYSIAVHVPDYYRTDRLASMSEDVVNGAIDLYTVVGGDVRAIVKGEYHSPSELNFTNDAKQYVSASILNNYGENKLYGRVYNGSDYLGAEIPVNDFLYTFQKNGDQYTISANYNGTTVYLCTEHGKIHSNELKETFELQQFDTSSAGTYFTFHSTQNNTDLFFWRWKMISNTKTIYETPSFLKSGTTRFLLYEKAASGTGSAELPGFNRVSEIKNGGQYLIAVVYKDEVKEKNYNCIYLLRPFLGGDNNSPLVERSDRHTGVSTEFAFRGLQQTNPEQPAVILTENAQIAGSNQSQIQVHVVDGSTAQPGNFYSQTGSASGYPVKNITISTGMTYQLELHDENGNKLSPSNIVWFSSNNEYATVDQQGNITTKEAGFLENQELRFVDIFAKDTVGGELYCIRLTIIKNSYGSTEYEINVIDHYIENLTNTEMFLGIPMYGSMDIQFQQLNAGDVTYLYRSNAKPWALNYFAKPKEGYALTYLNANNSAGQFYMLDDANPVNTQYYSSGVCGTQKTIYNYKDDNVSIHGDDVIAHLIQTALDAGCTNAFGFSQQINAGQKPGCKMICIAEKLPEVSKSTAYLLKQNGDKTAQNLLDSFKNDISSNSETDLQTAWRDYAYIPGALNNNVSNGDIVIFRIEIKHPPVAGGDSSITTVGDMKLVEKNGFLFVANDETELNASDVKNLTGNNSLVYYSYHTLTADEITQYRGGTEIVNTVSLSYTFRTLYQPNTDKTSTATARATVEFSVTNYVGYVNLTLDTGIHANVFFNSNVPSQWANQNYYVVMAVGGSSVKHKFTAADWTLKKDADNTGSTFSRYSIPVGITHLSDNISVHIEDSKGAHLTNDYIFTVNEYLVKLKGELDSGKSSFIVSWQKSGGTEFTYMQKDKLKTLITSLQNLGDDTNKWMGNVSVEAKKLTPDETASLEALYKPTISSSGNGIDYLGFNLELSDSSIGMRLYFKSAKPLNLQKVESIIKHVDSQNGKYYQFTEAQPIQAATMNDLTGWKDATPSEPIYYISIPNLSGKLLGNNYTVSIRRHDGSSYRETPDTITFSALSYVYLLTKTEGADPALVNMAISLYRYNVAAKDYFGDNGLTNA